jgi:hypothetical protein
MKEFYLLDKSAIMFTVTLSKSFLRDEISGGKDFDIFQPENSSAIQINSIDISTHADRRIYYELHDIPAQHFRAPSPSSRHIARKCRARKCRVTLL